MEKKINIAELLKDCPMGMELYCTITDGGVTLEYIELESPYPINVVTKDGFHHKLSKYGEVYSHDLATCVIFPKGKTTWEGFIPPCQFKAGDVIVSEFGNIVLFSHIDSENIIHYHCIIPAYGGFRIEENTSVGVGRYYECVLANEQQKQRMYDKIKCSGYKYNQYTNKLEKLIEPKFKVGDRIVKKNSVCVPISITKVNDEFYYTKTESSVGFFRIQEQDDWELFRGQFDITTLKPFDSKVLVRNANNKTWRPTIFGCYRENKHEPFYVLGGTGWKQCIPYEENKHLLGTTDDCDDYYKTW